jgi:hypothetical protein
MEACTNMCTILLIYPMTLALSSLNPIGLKISKAASAVYKDLPKADSNQINGFPKAAEIETFRRFLHKTSSFQKPVKMVLAALKDFFMNAPVPFSKSAKNRKRFHMNNRKKKFTLP